MSHPRLLCLGYGYVAAALTRLLAAEGSPWRVAGATRRTARLAAIEADGVAPVLWSDSGLPEASFDDVAAALVSSAPDADGCPSLHAAGAALSQRADRIRWVGYLSTNGVYGDHDGAWVDETAALRGASPRARNRVAAEEAWAAFGARHGIPVVIFRLPGIYGPGRSAFDQLRMGAAKRIYKQGQVFSRAHVDDIAGAVAASLAAPGAGALFNVADDEPAPPQDVVEYAARLIGLEPPPLTPIEEAEMSDMARSFYADNKRVRNTRMKEALGVRLAYPTYREGLRAILEKERGL